MKTTSLQSVSNGLTTAFSDASPVELVGDAASAQTEPSLAEVIVVNFEPTNIDDLPDGYVEIDELVARHEKNERRRRALEEARRWAADTFHSERESLAKLRLKKGLSQARLAEAVGTSQSHIARIENGTCDPQITTAARIASILEIDVSQFFEAFQLSGK